MSTSPTSVIGSARRTLASLPADRRRAAPARGSISIILGAMFSGKTTELLRLVKRHSLARHKVLLIKYSNDTRYSLSGICTHDRQESAARACTKLSDLEEEALAYDVIGIDEGSFFPDIVPFCERMATEHSKTVIVAALDGTYQRKPFGTVLDLIPLAENVVKLSAVCMICFRDAAFSKRIGSETEVEVIGGADKYMAVCRECYFAQDDAAETPTKTSEKARLSQSGVIQSLFHDKEAAPDNTDDAVKCDTDDADEDIHKDKA